MLDTAPGLPDQLGVTVKATGNSSVERSGVNFALFSYHATDVDLLLFDRPDAAEPSAILRLDPQTNRTGSYWHIFVSGLEAGQLYGYRINGPFVPEGGHRFDLASVLYRGEDNQVLQIPLCLWLVAFSPEKQAIRPACLSG